jgi:transposase
MTPPVSERRRGQVKVQVELGVPVKVIPSQTKVSHRSVERFKKNILEFGTTRCPKKDSQGRPKKITPEMERVCPFYTYFFIWKN